MPLIYGYTLWSQSIHWLTLGVLAVCLLLLALASTEYCWLYREKPSLTSILTETVHNPRPMFMTYLRWASACTPARLQTFVLHAHRPGHTGR